MDLLQKYTKDEIYYELDEAILKTLDNMNPILSDKMIIQIQKAADKVQRKNRRSQLIGGVLRGRDPVYFALRYVYEDYEPPYFFQLFDITSDEYLDLYNQNKII